MDINNEYEVIFTKQAHKEIKEIYRYISKAVFAENSAWQLMRALNSKISNIRIFPKMYRKIEIQNKEYRRLVVRSYIIIYRVNEEKKKIYIVHIFYSKSNYLEKL